MSGMRRSEIVGLDCAAAQTLDGSGWIEILEKGALVTLRGKTGWREVGIGRGPNDLACPVVAQEIRLKFGRIGHGPLFRRVLADGKTVDVDRPTDKHIARLEKKTRAGSGRAQRSHRGRAGTKIRRTFAARRPRLLHRGR